MKSKDIRLDIIFVIVLCASATGALAWFARIQRSAEYLSAPAIAVNILVFLLALVLEVGNLSRAGLGAIDAKDKGLLSAALTASALISLPVLSYFVFDLCVISSGYFWPLGVLVLLAGTWVRYAASRTLGRYFNHALIIRDDHRLIEEGIYRFVRHPAYLGTLLMILGSGWAFHTHVGLVLAAAGIPLALVRIRKEEAMLTTRFGDAYIRYQHRSNALIPGIL